MPFHENLTGLRKRAGLSQEELAEKLQLTRQTISKWETGLSEPDISRIKELCEVLGVSADALLYGEARKTDDKKQNEKRNTYEMFFYIFLLVVFVSAVFVLNSPRSLLDRQELAMWVMAVCVTIFLLIGMVKVCLWLFRKKRKKKR